MSNDSEAKSSSLSDRLIGLLSHCANYSLPLVEASDILNVEVLTLLKEINLETSAAHEKLYHDSSKNILMIKAEFQKKPIATSVFSPSLSFTGANIIGNSGSPATFASLAAGIGSIQDAMHGAHKHGFRNTMGDADSFGRQSSPIMGTAAKQSGFKADSSLSLTNVRRRGAIRKARLLTGLSLLPSQDLQTGRVGYVCVADEFNLSALETYYRSQGYYTKFDFDVLHVRFSDTDMQLYSHLQPEIDMSYGAGGATPSASPSGEKVFNSDGASPATRSNGKTDAADGGSSLAEVEAEQEKPFYHAVHSQVFNGFDLFLFEYGAVVWWGFNQRYFKIVESDFMLPHSPVGKYMTHRYLTQLVNENYPVWCTYSLTRKETVEVDEEFKSFLRFDHFLIPCGRGDPSMCSIAMLCASHALAQSAKIDYLEIKVQEATVSCAPLPRELREKGHATVSERRLLQLRGEVLSYRLMLRSGSDLIDEPSFFWENAYLKPVFQATKDVFEIASRVEALDNKLGANNEILSMLAEEFSQRHGARLEWIVIWLVLVEVIIGVLELCVDVRPWFRFR